MEKLDRMIEEALQEEDREILAQTAELGYFAQALGLFRGKTAWVNWVIMVVQTVMFLIGVWCAVNFFAATDVLEALKWGLSGAVMWILGAMMKMSLMPVMQTERVIRELKRVELMLARREG